MNHSKKPSYLLVDIKKSVSRTKCPISNYVFLISWLEIKGKTCVLNGFLFKRRGLESSNWSYHLLSYNRVKGLVPQ